jgi:nucleoside-diphosphate-sugar epimerase
MYAVSKCFGENLARYFAYVEGLSCIAVRIGAFEAPWILRSPDPVTPRQFVSKRDLCNLLIRCVETPDIPFAIVHGVSNNHPNRLDLEETHRLLGYKPQDEGLRWIAEQQPVGGL